MKEIPGITIQRGTVMTFKLPIHKLASFEKLTQYLERNCKIN